MNLFQAAYWPFLTHSSGDPLFGHHYRDVNGKKRGLSFPIRSWRIFGSGAFATSLAQQGSI